MASANTDGRVTTFQALEAMRWLLRLRIDRDGVESPLSRVLTEIEAGVLTADAGDWRTAFANAAAGEISDADAWDRATAVRPTGAESSLLTATQALDAIAEYCRVFISRADGPTLFAYTWTEFRPDGQTADPAAWGDWLDAVTRGGRSG